MSSDLFCEKGCGRRATAGFRTCCRGCGVSNGWRHDARCGGGAMAVVPCAVNCGRLANVGYDTCCRRCSLTQGREHDRHCRGASSGRQATSWFGGVMGGVTGGGSTLPVVDSPPTNRHHRQQGPLHHPFSPPPPAVKGVTTLEELVGRGPHATRAELASLLARNHRAPVSPRTLPDAMVDVAGEVASLALMDLAPAFGGQGLSRRSPLLVVRQLDCAALLAKAFFGTAAPRGLITLAGWLSDDAEPQVEKLKCLAAYFQAVAERRHALSEEATSWTGRELTFELKIADDATLFSSQRGESLRAFTIEAGGIESASGKEFLRADFANAKVGGGVLGRGLAQEEILFVTHSELLVATALFGRPLLDDEALEIRNVEKFAKYEGYGWADRKNKHPFAFAGPAAAEAPSWSSSDENATTDFVAFDATDFRGSGFFSLGGTPTATQQLLPRHVDRELTKCSAAFARTAGDDVDLARPLATGNWGGGVFGGDLVSRALIQWAAASAHGRDVHYFAYGADLGDLSSLVPRLAHLTVGALVDLLKAAHLHIADVRDLPRFLRAQTDVGADPAGSLLVQGISPTNAASPPPTAWDPDDPASPAASLPLASPVLLADGVDGVAYV